MSGGFLLVLDYVAVARLPRCSHPKESDYDTAQDWADSEGSYDDEHPEYQDSYLLIGSHD